MIGRNSQSKQAQNRSVYGKGQRECVLKEAAEKKMRRNVSIDANTVFLRRYRCVNVPLSPVHRKPGTGQGLRTPLR